MKEEFKIIASSIQKDKSILDVGCGDGELMKFIYENISIKILIMPFLIVSLEWIRSFGPLGFAWGNLAVTQMDMIHLLQFIEYGGTYIITFWVVLINLGIYYHFFKRSFSKQNLKSYANDSVLNVHMCSTIEIFHLL